MSLITLIVLAAGMGSRFGGPKQLTPIGPSGETILDYNTHDGIVAGFDKLVVVTRPELEEQVREAMQRGPARRVEVAIALQRIPDGRTKPLGTADAVAVTAPHVDGPFAVANSDDLYGPGSFEVLAQHMRDVGTSEGAVVGFRLSETVPGTGSVSRGILQVDDGEYLRAIVETHGIQRSDDAYTPSEVPGIGPLTGGEPVSMNLWGLPHPVMARLQDAVERFVAQGAGGEVYLPEVVAELIGDGLRVRMLRSAEQWAGMTNPEDVEVVRAYAAKRWQSPLWD